MLALTVHQPWASLIVLGLKDIENRRWVPPAAAMRQPLYIHAGKQWDHGGFRTAVELAGEAFLRDREAYPLGAVIGRVTLADHHTSVACVRLGRLAHVHPDGPYECSRWAMGGNGGMSHWCLANPVPLPEPVPCRGFQKLWTLPPEVAERVTAQLNNQKEINNG